MTRSRSLCTLAAVLSLAAISMLLGCQTSRVRTLHAVDPEVDISAYATYAWATQGAQIAPGPGQAHLSEMDDARIRRAVDRELQARGFRQATSPAQAQLIVRYLADARPLPVAESVPGSDSVLFGFNGPVTGHSTPMLRMRARLVGWLQIQFEGRDSREAVWMGQGMRVLSRHKTRTELIDEIVQRILAPVPART